MRTTFKELEWLHDCDLLDIVFDTSDDAGRVVRWTLRCPEDLGYSPWNGKELVLVATDVAMFWYHIAWGVLGPETINGIQSGISDAARESVMDAYFGTRFLEIELTMYMHSRIVRRGPLRHS